MKVIEGPVVIGNVCGHYGCKVPAGKFAVVENGEYSNGGHGPSTVNGMVYRTRERAETIMAEIAARRATAIYAEPRRKIEANEAT